MANIYVYSGAAGAGTGADWANAKTTLAAAATASVDGDVIYVADDHAESQSGTTLAVAPASVRILCVSRAGSVPPVAADLRTTATVSTTGATAMTITVATALYVYGVTFSCATTGNVFFTFNGSGRMVFERCNLRLGATNSGSRFNISQSTVRVDLINCTYRQALATQGWAAQGIINVKQRDQPFYDGSVAPNYVVASGTGTIVVSSADLSGFNGLTAASSAYSIRFVGCLLPAAPSIGGPTTTGQTVIEDCNVAGGGIRRDERYGPSGNLTTELTVVRTGGANDGATAFSWKIGTGSAATPNMLFDTPDGVIYNTAVGSSKTLTVHLINDGVTLQNADVILEVEYLNTAGSPQTIVASSAPAPLVAATNLPADNGAVWNTTGLAAPVQQQVSLSFTPQVAGPIKWRLRSAKANTAYYACPKAELV